MCVPEYQKVYFVASRAIQQGEKKQGKIPLLDTRGNQINVICSISSIESYPLEFLPLQLNALLRTHINRIT